MQSHSHDPEISCSYVLLSMARYLAHNKSSISIGYCFSWLEIIPATLLLTQEVKNTQRRRGVSRVIGPVSKFITVSEKWLSLGIVLEMGKEQDNLQENFCSNG